MRIKIDEIAERVSKKLNLNKGETEDILRFQFKFLMDTMQSGEFKNVQLLHLGKFFVKEEKRKYKRFKEENKNNEPEKVQ